MLRPRFLVVASSTIVVSFVVCFSVLELNNSVDRGFVFNIYPGDNIPIVSKRLYDRGDLPVLPFTFQFLGVLTRQAGDIKAGQYQVREGMKTLDLLRLFRSDSVVKYRMTFPEGWNLRDWRRALGQAPFLEQTIVDLDDMQLKEMLGISDSLEGWFFPDTYQYVSGDSDLDLLKRAHRRMKSVIASEWAVRDPSIDLDNPFEAIILASIIEKETGLDEDRAKIASVFHNRLRLGMKLQSDPTVIFGVGEDFDGDLKRSHLTTDTAYNTYTRRGLPPGAICSPGRASIRAALSGSAHPYIYFVGMGDGRSFFSKTLAEHNRAVDQFQRLRH